MQSDLRRKKMLYRRVNTRTHGVRHGNGAKAKWDRNTKSNKNNEKSHGSMHSHHRHGLDYTPLFKFLLSRVGCDWDEVFSEAVARLDRKEPIFWIVAHSDADKKPFVRVGASSYFSGLFVDDENKLALVDPNLTVDEMQPTCACCTHTFNGERFTQKYSEI